MFLLHAFVPAFIGFMCAVDSVTPVMVYETSTRQDDAWLALKLWGVALLMFFVWPVIIPTVVIWFTVKGIWTFLKVLRGHDI